MGTSQVRLGRKRSRTMLNTVPKGIGFSFEMEETDFSILGDADVQLLRALFRELRPLADPSETGPIRLAYADFVKARIAELKAR